MNEINEQEHRSRIEKNVTDGKVSAYQTNHHKSLERVGQYLKDEKLKQPVDRSNNPWYNFLNQNPEFYEVPFIIQVNENTSLVQEYNKLNSSVRSIFSSMTCDMTEKCTIIGYVKFPSVEPIGKCTNRDS